MQRIGYDSFTPDNGVLLAKNKDSSRGDNGGPNAFNSFIWVIDAHPEDMNRVDYVKPNGTRVMRTVADYRQLNDALFHAGLNSRSQYEWEDDANRLHFYVIDLQRDARGIRNYTLAVRSLSGNGSQTRDVAVTAPAAARVGAANTPVTFAVRNTGAPANTDRTLHTTDARAYVNGDVYRLSVSVEGAGWTAELANALTAVKTGATGTVQVFVSPGSAASATVTLTAVSESDPSKRSTATVRVSR